MNRWLLIGSLAGLMFAFTGCATCSKSGCGSAGSGSCSSGSCGLAGGGGGMLAASRCGGSNCQGNCGSGSGTARGMMSRAAGMVGCNACGGSGCGRPGCVAGELGWQSGGLDYSSHLQTGLMGHTAARNLNGRSFTPGPPTGQVAYPYYTHRGPRDFFLDKPPTIGR